MNIITPTSEAYYFACILGGILLIEILVAGIGITLGRWLSKRKRKDVPVWLTQIFK